MPANLPAGVDEAMVERAAIAIDATIWKFFDPTPGQQAIAALTAALGDTHVVVPARALAWLFGEAPDADGKWFGDTEVKPIAGRIPKFWWRSKFRAMIAFAPNNKESS